MLEEHWWGLAIPVSQIACEGPSKTHLAWGAWGSTSGEALISSTTATTTTSLISLAASFRGTPPVLSHFIFIS
jgi:hypothetical protein